MESSKSRYFRSFLISATIYMVVILGFFYGSTKIIKHVDAKKDKIISLNHIVLKHEEKKSTEPDRQQTARKEVLKKKERKVLKKSKPKVENKDKKKVIQKKSTQKKSIKPKNIISEKIKIKKKESVEEEMVKKASLSQKKEYIKIKKTKSQEIRKIDYKKEYLSVNFKKILTQIQKNIKYPRVAKKRNIVGVVMVEFKLYPNGSIGVINALSGHRILKESAIEAITRASKYFPKVQEPVLLKLPISYTLS